MEELEKVQKKATKEISELEQLPYKEILQSRGSKTEVYKIMQAVEKGSRVKFPPSFTTP